MKTPIVVFALLAASAATGQQNPPATVIRTETRVVQVDAVVTDRGGNPIPGLTAQNFRLWEDNKEQKISSVSLEDHSGRGAAPSYTVLVFNNMALENNAGTRVRQAAAELAAHAGPRNLMSVAEYSNRGLRLTQNFTADAERLRQVISGPHVAPTANSVQAGSAVRVPITAGNGAFLGQQDQLDFLQAIGGLAAGLRDFGGRKTVVLFGAGAPVDRDNFDALRQTIDLCNRVDVSIYPLEAGGLTSPMSLDQPGRGAARGPGRGPSTSDADPSAPINDQLLHSLAKGTGGYVIEESNDLSGRMARVMKEESGYYLLAYTPAESPDGSCHALRVKVDRSAEVRARSTYCNTRPPDLLAGKPIEHTLESRLAGDQPGNLAASIQLPYFYSSPGVALVNIAMEVPSELFRFDKVKGRYHGEANVLGIAYAPDGTVAARFSDTVPFDLANPIEVDEFHSSPLHYEKQLRIAPGKYTFKAVFAGAGEKAAKVEAPLDIGAFAAGGLMVSGLALSREMRPASEGGNTTAELMDGRIPLVYHDGRVVPFGGNRFPRTDSLVIYLQVYDPDAGSAHPPALDVRTRVLDRGTGAEKLNGAVRIEAAEVAGKQAVPYALQFALETLPPAWYTAEVKVTDTGGKSMTRTVDFEVR